MYTQRTAAGTSELEFYAFFHFTVNTFTNEGEHTIDKVRTDDYTEYYKAHDGHTEVSITVHFHQTKVVNTLVLKENIQLSQRIESFEIWAGTSGRLHKVAEGTVVGYKKIVLLNSVECDELVIKIKDSRVSLSFIGIYS